MICNFLKRLFGKNKEDYLAKLLNNISKSDPEVAKKIQQCLEEHHQNLIRSHESPEIAKSVSSLSFVKSILTGKKQEHINHFKSSLHKHSLELGTDAEGVIQGFGKYEAFDIRWTEVFIVFLQKFRKPEGFKDNPPIIQISDDTNLAILGDFGAGTWEGNDVVQKIKDKVLSLNPEYAVHIGDVYYAGKSKEAEENFLGFWPEASKGNFSLNGNHEMFDGAHGYFETILKNPIFAAQKGNSYFALENSNWIIACLDTSFFSDLFNHENSMLYDLGKLNDSQIHFLKDLKNKNKNFIIITHHDPLKMNGMDFEDLFAQVHDILGDQLKYWYYGHRHYAAVYNDIKGVKFRLNGHGSLPFGSSSNILDGKENIKWYAEKSPIIPNGIRFQNGFCYLKLNGAELQEEFYGEDGKIHWKSY